MDKLAKSPQDFTLEDWSKIPISVLRCGICDEESIGKAKLVMDTNTKPFLYPEKKCPSCDSERIGRMSSWYGEIPTR